jgi:hypothetical protein
MGSRLSAALVVCVTLDSQKLHPHVVEEYWESLTLSWDDDCSALNGIRVFLLLPREVFTETFPSLPDRVFGRGLLMNPKTSLPIDDKQRDSSAQTARDGEVWNCAGSLALENSFRSLSPTELMVHPCPRMLAFSTNSCFLCFWA